LNIELECPICRELLARPLAIYPCGHIFCEDCLLQTFFTPLPGEDSEINHATRIKQCPDCRTCLHTPPIPVYLVKNIISFLHPELSKDESRTNGFGLILSSAIPGGADPWSVLFPEDLADAMTLTSESDAEDQLTGISQAQGQQAALDPWETAVGYLSQSVRSDWGLNGVITMESSEASGDETPEGAEVESSTSSDSTARMYNIAPLFANSSTWRSSPGSSDTEQLSSQYSPPLQSEERDQGQDSMVVDDVDAFQPYHLSQQFLMSAYKQFHRVPSPIRNCSWVARTYEPPRFISEENEDFMTAQEKTLHQRGIPLDMQDKFQIAYTNRLGLSVQLGLGNVIFLGWNVYIFWTMGDRTGEVFMAYIRWEMRNHPERWNVHIHSDGSWDAHRLRCVNVDTGADAYASLGEDYMEGSDTG
jgi:RING-type zinc-finger